MYQLFVGEIGFQRREFLSELRWWEVKSIIRGYNARHHSSWEQARLIAYNAHFCMGSCKPVPTVGEWMKFPWEFKHHATTGDGDMPTTEEVEAMRRQMAEMNAEFERKKKESGGQQ